MNVLPPEIVSLILDYLYYSMHESKRRRCLAQCLSVNKAFFLQARARMFSSIDLSWGEREKELHHLKQILEYDAPGYPPLTSCVRHFTYLGRELHENRTIHIRDVFLLLARPLSNLQTLELHFLFQSFYKSFDRMVVYNALQSLCRVPTLQRLIIRHANSVPINFLEVANFKTLELDEVTFIRDEDFELSGSRTKVLFTTSLRHLRITLRSLIYFPPEFIPDANPSAFSELERMAVHATGSPPIDVKPRWDISAKANQHLDRIFSLSKDTLKHLEFLISITFGIPSTIHSQSLASLHKLERLSYFIRITNPISLYWESIFQILTSIEVAPPPLRYLLLHFHIPSDCGWTVLLHDQFGEVAGKDRRALLDILSSDRFASVEQIKFVLHLCGKGAATADVPFLNDFPVEIRDKYASRFEVVILRDEVIPWFGISEYK